MTISPARLAQGAIALAVVAASLPALGQQSPESLLPPGFGDPVPTPQPTAAPRPAPLPGVPAPGPVPAPSPSASIAPTPTPTPSASPTPIDPELLAEYELPSYARRSLSVVGLESASDRTMGADAFGRADGRFLEVLMRRLDAPLPSRWLSIALRRALARPLATPPGVNGSDFAAERAWLLLRMGEAVAARGVVQSVDIENYTPKLLQVAMQTALATADPAAMCGFADRGQAMLGEQGWTLSQAMCTALGGNAGQAGKEIDAARRRGRMGNSIDLLLAEKVVGAGSSGRRAVTVEWDMVEQLTAWRFGLATATGVEIPERLLATTGPRVTYWRALSPVLSASERAPAAEAAAAQGVLSHTALVDLYGVVRDNANDAASAPLATARDLADAYAERDAARRVAAMRRLWNAPQQSGGRYARLVMTARAASLIPPDPALADDADRLIGSMLTAGLDLPALRWQPVVPAGSEGWALLALADPSPTGRVAAGDLRRFVAADESVDKLRGQMLAAGLAGLGRIDVDEAERAGVAPLDNRWTRAIDFAARRRQPGTVLLLSAVAMQTATWRGVPPAVLYRMVAALSAVGLNGEARMIAAEAVTRLA